MKKLYLLLAAVALVVALAACETTVVEFDEVEVPVEVPAEVPAEVPVEVPVDVPVEVPVDVPPEVFVDQPVSGETVIVTVPAERAQSYEPGTYFRASAVTATGYYYYAVVIVDAYGQIAGVAFDRTETQSQFLTNAAKQLFVYIAGDGVNIPNSYRLIKAADKPSEYPSINDAITADDLREGLNNESIAALTKVNVYETARVLADGVVATSPAALVAVSGLIAQYDLLAAKIVADQTTYGVQLVTTATNVRAKNVNITGTVRLNNADVLVGLVQSILDGPAVLQAGTSLPALADAEHGLYQTGMTFGQSARIVKTNGDIVYTTSFTAVDEFGRIAGVFVDETFPQQGSHLGTTTGKSSKQIVGVVDGIDFRAQTGLLSAAIVQNQSFSAFAERQGSHLNKTNFFTDDVDGFTLDLFNLHTAINGSIPKDNELRDGVYFAQDDTGMFVYVVVRSKSINSIFIDIIEASDQAQVVGPDGTSYPLFTYDVQRVFGTAIEGTATLVYQDRGAYYLLVNGRVPATQGQRVTFARNETAGIDEEATLAPVVGNTTAQMLGDAWMSQSDLLTNKFSVAANNKSAYALNLDADGATNSEFKNSKGDVSTFILNGLAVRNLIEEALLDAVAAAKAVAKLPTGASPAAQNTAALPFQYSAVGEANTAVISVGQRIANGLYFGASPANVDGDIVFGYAVVKNNRIETLIVEGTRLDEKSGIVLLTILGDAEFKALNELEDGKDDFYELIGADVVKVTAAAVQTSIITQLLTQGTPNYDFTSRTIFGQPTAVPATGLSERFGASTLLVVEEVAKRGIENLVAERAADLGKLHADLVTAVANTTVGRSVTNPLHSQQVYTPIGFDTPTITSNRANAIGYSNSRDGVISTGVTFSRVTFESNNRDVLDVDAATGKITVRRLEQDGTATVTMRAEFDNQEYVYTTTYNAYTIANYNRLILDQLHKVQRTAVATGALAGSDNSIPIAQAGIRFLQGVSVPLEAPSDPLFTAFSKNYAPFLLEDEILISGSSGPVVTAASIVPLTRDGGIASSGFVGTTENFGYFLNFGQSTAKAMNNLDTLTAGTYTLTAVIRYDHTAGATQEITRRIVVTIVSEADAIASALASVSPSTLLPGGEITETSYSLPRTTSIFGILVSYELIRPAGNGSLISITDSQGVRLASLVNPSTSRDTTLTLQRNYSDEKFTLRANLVRGYFLNNVANGTTGQAALIGSPQLNYEFTVKQNTDLAVITRIEAAVAKLLDFIPLAVEFDVDTRSTSSSILISAESYQSGAVLLSAADVTDKPTFRFELTTKEENYYVLPAGINVDSQTKVDAIDPVTLSGINYFVVFRNAVSGKSDSGSGVASIAGGVYAHNSVITITGAAVTNDVPFLIMDAVTGEVFVHNNDELAIAAEARVPVGFKIVVVSRILLSTDSVGATKEVNSSKITKEVLVFVSPFFKPVSVQLAIDSGAKAIDITLEGGGQFVSRELVPSDFLIYASGIDKTVLADFTSSGLNAGLKVVRTSNNSARLYGFNAITTPGTDTVDTQIEINVDALRFLPSSINGTVVKNQFGIARIGTAATRTNLTINGSGQVSGTFSIFLTDDKFDAYPPNIDNFEDDGIPGIANLIPSGLIVTIGGNIVTEGSGITFSVFPNYLSQLMIITASGTLTGFTPIVGVPVPITITVKHEILQNSTANLEVLVGNEQRSLIAKPRFTLTRDE